MVPGKSAARNCNSADYFAFEYHEKKRGRVFPVDGIFCFAFDGENPGVKTLATIGTVEVKLDTVYNVIRYVAEMNIDADGSPRAYHPVSDSGLDALANAGHKGNWWEIATNEKGEPCIQGKTIRPRDFMFPQLRYRTLRKRAAIRRVTLIRKPSRISFCRRTKTFSGWFIREIWPS